MAPRHRAAALRDLVDGGAPVGILALAGDEPVGWYSIGPRESYTLLARTASLAPIDDAQVWSVACFFVAPPHRKRGVATSLLRAAVEYARTMGARAIEGYPVPGNHADARMGSTGTFRRAGFRDVTPPGRRRRIMRNVVG